MANALHTLARPGLPMRAAEITTVPFPRLFEPADPAWPDRDLLALGRARLDASQQRLTVVSGSIQPSHGQFGRNLGLRLDHTQVIGGKPVC